MFPVIMDSEVPKEKMDAAVEDLNQSLNVLEEKFLQSRPFIVGDKISLADLVAVVEIMQVMLVLFLLLLLVGKYKYKLYLYSTCHVRSLIVINNSKTWLAY